MARLSLAGALVGVGRLAGMLVPSTEAAVWLGLGVALALAVAYLSPQGAFGKGMAVGGLASAWAWSIGALGGQPQPGLLPGALLTAFAIGFLSWVAAMVLHAERRETPDG